MKGTNMRNTETRTIDGLEFEIMQLGFTKQRRIFLTLTKALGPALASALGSARSLKEIDAAAVSVGLTDAMERLDEPTLADLSREFGEACRYVSSDGKRPLFRPEIQETIFSGRILTYFKWLAACVEVNYSDFFAALRPALGAESEASDQE